LSNHTAPKPEDFNDAVKRATAAYPGIDSEKLHAELEILYSVFIPEETILTDPTGHEEWINEWRAKAARNFWYRYERYLEQEKHLPPQSITRLDNLTDRILGLLESPMRSGEWDRRGIVVGQVQSGKTANYTGLICKAADAGYKLIIVMAGIHNSLRSQTQLRIDEGFLGRDTKQDRVFRLESPRIGVGKIRMPDENNIAAHSMTTSDENGDFKKSTAKNIATYIGDAPVVLVIKKNGSILKNLLGWILHNIGEKNGDIKVVPGHIPLMLIDDEADNASINTKQLIGNSSGKFNTKQDVTRINALIRQLLKSFTRSAYVGYTATPFANIFIPHDADTEIEGEDLFPRSFIINLPAPSNYIGPIQVFGLASKDLETSDGLPIRRYVRDSDDILPGRHTKELTPSYLPDSLKQAIRAFILTCAARAARGQTNAHNSMLIHVTRFVNVQSIMCDLVNGELRTIRNRLEYGDGARTPSLRDELLELWNSDFVPTTESVQRQMKGVIDIKTLTWDDIDAHLSQEALKIEVKQINGTAKDVLDYYDHKNGHSVIAIGGDKLSRGLTLEGLSVSYYLRASRMYDTLMQMGRWFGYRPGYADLCRLYTTPELEDWYIHITVASEELREDFEVMAGQGHTPEQYGLKVRTHPGGLTITSAGKLRYGTKIKVAYSGQLVETYRLSKENAYIENNFKATDEFIRNIEHINNRPDPDKFIWIRVPAEKVIEFLNTLWGDGDSKLPPTPASKPKKLAEFINLKNKKNELTEWTVALISPSTSSNTYMIGDLEVKLPIRIPSQDSTNQTYVVRNRHILTESNEWIDCSQAEIDAAIAMRNEWEKQKDGEQHDIFTDPNGKSIRAIRPKQRGLLLIYPLDPSASRDDKSISVFPDDDNRRNGKPIIGYAISFPGSNSREDLDDAVEYVVNQIYLKEELDGYRMEEELNNDDA
jgi:hypothetical protein